MLIVGLVKTLLVSVCEPVKVASVVGNVLVPLVKSLFVSTCVLAVPTTSPSPDAIP